MQKSEGQIRPTSDFRPLTSVRYRIRLTCHRADPTPPSRRGGVVLRGARGCGIIGVVLSQTNGTRGSRCQEGNVERRQKRTGKFRRVVERADVTRELRRIHAVVRSHDVAVIFRWFHGDRHLYGTYHGSRTYLWVRVDMDPWKEIVGTFVHEMLHHIHPEWSEVEVSRFERRVLRHASPAQLRRLLARCLALWQMTLIRRRRGKRTPPCPLCGKGIA